MSTASGDYASNGPGERDPEKIARAIDETRGEVDETLDALQARLSPGELLDRAMQLMRDSGGQFANNLGRSVRDNPLPLVLTGIGLAWMITASRTTTPGNTSTPGDTANWRDSSSGWSGAGEEVSRAGAGTIAAARDKVAGAVGSVSDAAAATADRLSQGVQSTTDLLRSQGRRMSASFSGFLDEQPLVVGAIGVAVGALLGYLLPATDVEDRLLGEASDRTTRRAADAASAQLDEASEQVSRSARQQPPAGNGGSDEPPMGQQTSVTQGPAEDHEARGLSERT